MPRCHYCINVEDLGELLPLVGNDIYGRPICSGHAVEDKACKHLFMHAKGDSWCLHCGAIEKERVA